MRAPKSLQSRRYPIGTQSTQQSRTQSPQAFWSAGRLGTQCMVTYNVPILVSIYVFIIQHIDTLPKYGQNTLDVRRST